MVLEVAVTVMGATTPPTLFLQLNQHQPPGYARHPTILLFKLPHSWSTQRPLLPTALHVV